MGFKEYGPLRALLIIMCLIFVRLLDPRISEGTQ